MHIWTIEKWIEYLDYDNNHYRTGLRLKFEKGIDAEVRRACKEFCKWIRTEYYFPVRIPVYVKKSKYIKAMDGDFVNGTFFKPFNKIEEPYARIATGFYHEDLLKRGKDNSLASVLLTIAHELTHYFQWINNIQLTEIGEERQATRYARLILDEYAQTHEHP
jgi:hypothetical protein